MEEPIELLPLKGERVSFLGKLNRDSGVTCKKCNALEYEHSEIITHIPYRDAVASFIENVLKCPLCNDIIIPTEQGNFNKVRFDRATRVIDMDIKAQQDKIDKEYLKKLLTRICYGAILVLLLTLGVLL